MPNRERCWKCNGLGVESVRTYVKVQESLDSVTVIERLVRAGPDKEGRVKCDVCDGRGWLLCD